MSLQNPYILILVVSVFLLLLGYTKRATNWGPYSMLAGAFGLLGVIVYRVAVAVG